MMPIIVTALCNQPVAFASDLGDDQSRYLFSTEVSVCVTCCMIQFQLSHDMSCVSEILSVVLSMQV